MKTIALQSGTYAVDDILQGFDIIERPSSNVAFVGTIMITNQMYVQFKNGSGYMYSEVDLDTLSFVPVAESIGKFISLKVIKLFPSKKADKALITALPTFDEEQQAISRLNRKSQCGPVLVLTGEISNLPLKKDVGQIFQMSEGATIEYIEPQPEQEPEF